MWLHMFDTPPYSFDIEAKNDYFIGVLQMEEELNCILHGNPLY